MVTQTPLSNTPEFSVTDLAQSIKRVLEDGFTQVRVRGELSRVQIPSSGHLYTGLKDQNSLIDAVCWRSTLPRLRVKPEEGLEVICTGKITTYPARSNYQLIIEQMELAGVGALLKMIEDRRVRLAAEGLFDAARKRALPLLPRRVGVITSPTGAVIRDILHRLNDRFPVDVLIWPVAVQGESAASEVIRAIQGMNALPPDSRPDILIVARGGGSIEDLMPFNDEGVVRAAAASALPLISAVGHETDTTLIDYAADRRAPTPTAAAEFAVPVRDDVQATVSTLFQQLSQATRRSVIDGRSRVQTAAAMLGSVDRFLGLPRQRLDHIDLTLGRATTRYIERAQAGLDRTSARLATPQRLVAAKQELLQTHGRVFDQAAGRIMPDPTRRLNQAARLLETLSFRSVLQRGYALVRDAGGQVVRAAADAPPGATVSILFGDNTSKDAKILPPA